MHPGPVSPLDSYSLAAAELPLHDALFLLSLSPRGGVAALDPTMPTDDSSRICRALIGAAILELLLQGRIWPVAKEDESPTFREYRETALLPAAKRERITACVLRDGASPTGNLFIDRILSYLERNPDPTEMLPASIYADLYYASESHWDPPRWHRDQKPFVAADLTGMGLFRKRPWGGGGFSLTTTGAAARNAMQTRLSSCLVEDATLLDREKYLLLLVRSAGLLTAVFGQEDWETPGVRISRLLPYASGPAIPIVSVLSFVEDTRIDRL